MDKLIRELLEYIRSDKGSHMLIICYCLYVCSSAYGFFTVMQMDVEEIRLFLFFMFVMSIGAPLALR